MSEQPVLDQQTEIAAITRFIQITWEGASSDVVRYLVETAFNAGWSVQPKPAVDGFLFCATSRKNYLATLDLPNDVCEKDYLLKTCTWLTLAKLRAYGSYEQPDFEQAVRTLVNKVRQYNVSASQLRPLGWEAHMLRLQSGVNMAAFEESYGHLYRGFCVPVARSKSLPDTIALSCVASGYVHQGGSAFSPLATLVGAVYGQAYALREVYENIVSQSISAELDIKQPLCLQAASLMLPDNMNLRSLLTTCAQDEPELAQVVSDAHWKNHALPAASGVEP